MLIKQIIHIDSINSNEGKYEIVNKYLTVILTNFEQDCFMIKSELGFTNIDMPIEYVFSYITDEEKLLIDQLIEKDMGIMAIPEATKIKLSKLNRVVINNNVWSGISTDTLEILVHACAGRFRGRGMEYDDLYSAGCVGLIKAYDNFDESRGVCFSTYAVPVILGEIKKLFRDGGTVKVSRSLKELGMRVQAAREHTMKLCGSEPTLQQLAEQLDEPIENVALAIQAAQPAMSLTPEGGEDGDRQLDIPVESPEEELADKISLAEVIEALPEQDKQLIRLRFYGNRTQSETAKALHTTQVQISRRERKILIRLRARLLEE